MKKLMMVLLCFLILVTAVPVRADVTATVQKAEKMTKTGYLQGRLPFKSMPLAKSKTIMKAKINAEIKYRIFNKNWVIAVYKWRLGFFQRSKVAQSKYTPSQFRRAGVLRWGGWKWTWYSQRILPGHGLRIPGRHLDSRNFVCDKNNYICLASTSVPRYSVIKTPFGKLGKVYDSGCSRGVMDCYVGW